jgi:hypothetical protein
MSMNVLKKKNNTFKNHAQQKVHSLITLSDIICSLTDTINEMFNFYIFKIIEMNEFFFKILPHRFVC